MNRLSCQQDGSPVHNIVRKRKNPIIGKTSNDKLPNNSLDLTTQQQRTNQVHTLTFNQFIVSVSY